MNLSICDKSKTCERSVECYQAKAHDCGDYGCNNVVMLCAFMPAAKCIPVEAGPAPVKPKGSRSIVMKDVIDENVTLKMRVHQLEVSLKGFTEMPTMRRIVWAVKGGAE